MAIKLLIDNSSLDEILRWPEEARFRLMHAARDRSLSIYFAPETLVELTLVGATRNAQKLPALASLAASLMTGRIFEQWFRVVEGEVLGRNCNRFLRRRDGEILIQRLQDAKSGALEIDWLHQGDALVRKSKVQDGEWRTGFQELYRAQPLTFRRDYRRDLVGFCKLPSVQKLRASKVQAICKWVNHPDPASRTKVLLENMEFIAPMLSAHLSLRIARLWWYTESCVTGRKATEDEFDDALLLYMSGLDWLVTADNGLKSFFPAFYPSKRVLGPDEFFREVDQ